MEAREVIARRAAKELRNLVDEILTHTEDDHGKATSKHRAA